MALCTFLSLHGQKWAYAFLKSLRIFLIASVRQVACISPSKCSAICSAFFNVPFAHGFLVVQYGKKHSNNGQMLYSTYNGHLGLLNCGIS